ncbi:leucine-rich repeat-containing protein [Tanacetum coccineum]
MTSCGISGQIPEWISSQKELEYLDLSGNKLEGRFPHWLAEMNNIQWIYLSDNNLNGQIPPRLFESDRLEVLDLSRNNFSGELPENIGNTTSIYYLAVSENDFSGLIPKSISNLTGLLLLDLSRNRFSGNLPVLGANYLDLSDNDISGKIPANFPERTEILYLGGNKFAGSLPINLTKLVNLRVLDLRNSIITGNLQDILPQIPTLEILILRNTFLNGFIPNKALQYNLTSIESFDVSHNELSGSIPQSLDQLGQLTVLDVSNNMLTGKIPRGRKMDTMDDEWSYQNNSGLCGMQINIKCPEVIPSSEGRVEEDEDLSWMCWEGTWIGFPIGFFSTILIMSYLLKFIQLFKISNTEVANILASSHIFNMSSFWEHGIAGSIHLLSNAFVGKSELLLLTLLDSWSWLLGDKGIFTVKSLREKIDEVALNATITPQKTKWNTYIPRKTCIFVWRLQQRRLPVRSWLHHIGMDLNTNSLPSHCDTDIETFEHCFMSCPRVVTGWEKVFKWWNMGNFNVGSVGDIINYNGQNNYIAMQKKCWQAVCWGMLAKGKNESGLRGLHWTGIMPSKVSSLAYVLVLDEAILCSQLRGSHMLRIYNLSGTSWRATAPLYSHSTAHATAHS